MLIIIEHLINTYCVLIRPKFNQRCYSHPDTGEVVSRGKERLHRLYLLCLPSKVSWKKFKEGIIQVELGQVKKLREAIG